MAQIVAVVRETLSATASGTTDFTRASFGTPTAAIIIVCNANSTNNPEDIAVMSIGFWDGTNQRVCSIADHDNVTTTESWRASDDSYGVIVGSNTAPSSYTVSSITDGIRLTLTVDNTTLTRYATVILFNGITSSAITFTPNAIQDATSVSASLGFSPKLIFFTCIGATTADIAYTTAHAIISFGFAALDGTNRCVLYGSTAAAADQALSLLFSESRCVGQLFSGTLSWSGEVTSFGADTFTMTTRDGASGSDVCFALALGGDVSYDVGTLSTPVATGDDTVATDISPDAILSVLTTAKGTTIEQDSDANGITIGLADDNGQFSHNIYSEDFAAITNTGSVASATALINLDTSAAGSRAELIDGTVVLNNSDFTISYTAVDAAARKGWWVVFGNAIPQTPLGTVTSGGSSMFRKYFRKRKVWK